MGFDKGCGHISEKIRNGLIVHVLLLATNLKFKGQIISLQSYKRKSQRPVP